MQEIALICIPLLPLVGALLSYLCGSKNKSLSGIVATSISFCAFFISCALFFSLKPSDVVLVDIFKWIDVGILRIDFSLRFDALSSVMTLIVTGVGGLIFLYSIGYMAQDESRPRYFSYLSLFLFAMLLLVLGSNLLVLFVGWEGVGLCSYLLIGFWFKNQSFARAGRKAFIVNRIGDAGFLLGIFLIFYHFGTLDFESLRILFVEGKVSSELSTFIALCLFVGATGKSAQIPLFVWLPDAMAGPTPVSALIHAATMVTAGVYLLARMFFVFELAPLAMLIVCIVALLTALIAALTAMCQDDIKKVLAYSTISQLGFMFLGASVGAYWAAIFHVTTHAFFKACLFLGAGSIIHGCHGEQNLKKMGGLKRFMPVTFATYLVSVLAISGIFPFSGYQSKHAILGAIKSSSNLYIEQYATLFYLVASFTAFLTAFYMTRSLLLAFYGEFKGSNTPHESSSLLTVPLIVLAFFAVVSGVLVESWLPNHLGFYLPIHNIHNESGLLTYLISGIKGSFVGIGGLVLGFLLYVKIPSLPQRINEIFKWFGFLFSRKFFVDELYGFFIVQPLEKGSYKLWKYFDVKIVDGIVNGAALACEKGGAVLRMFHTGQVRSYSLYILAGTFLIIAVYIL